MYAVNCEKSILLTDKTLQLVADSNLVHPFVVLNMDVANEPRAHKIQCDYIDASKPDGMKPDSKNQNNTGNHCLILDSDLPQGTTKNCICWN